VPGTVDAVIVGSGPNGLAAAVELARNGASTLVLEAEPTIGGGTRSGELTLPGFVHDICSGAHPLGIISPYLSALPLARHGLEWIPATVSVAHPLDGQRTVILEQSVDATADGLDRDASAYHRLMDPLLTNPAALLEELLGPAHLPRHPLLLARFGIPALLPANALARRRFRGQRARALFAGCAAHSVLPFSRPASAAAGLVFLLTAHMQTWPVARGGSAAISNALASYLTALGGRIETDARVTSLSDLPEARAYLFDTSPAQVASIAGPILPTGYVDKLRRFRYGPGVCKVDWALDGPIPWIDPAALGASTVHLGGTLDEIAAGEAAVWRGEHSERPYVLLVQQSQFDASRAPAGKHTGWAYCHVPSGSSLDRSEVIERQVERFAPGFRDRILARHLMTAVDVERNNLNNVGGAITGGVIDLLQLYTRPAIRLDPYSTPNPHVFICSASTPPGGGVHGMCGYHAARSALRGLPQLARTRLDTV
jgi:phytoene dehydrogenase-like protein